MKNKKNKKEDFIRIKKKMKSQVEQLHYFVKNCKISLTAGIVLMICMFVSNLAYENANTEIIEDTLFLNQYKSASDKLTLAAESYTITGDQVFYDLYYNELSIYKNREDAIEKLENNHIKDDEWVLLNEIISLSNALVPYEEMAIGYAGRKEWEEAKNIIYGETYQNIVLNIRKKTEEAINTIYDRLEMQKFIILHIEIAMALLFIGSLINLQNQCRRTMKYSRQELLLPIVKVSEYMEKLSEGDFSASLDMEEDDSETGRMVTAINNMRQNNIDMIGEVANLLEQMGRGDYRIDIKSEYKGDFINIKESLFAISENMKETVGTIQEAARQIGTSSKELATVSDDLALSCTTQAGQLSDVMLLMNILEDSINYNEKEAEEAAKISRSSKDALDISNAKIEELKDAIGEIYRRSDQINDIVASIEEIASETDMLSLNAAIEAARAGEAGRGFSVVAEQVKKLAEESAQAARETSQLIQITVNAVENGIRLADEAVADTDEVLVGTVETTERIDRMVEKLKVEAENMQQINEAIAMVAGLVDNNAMTADETAMVSSEQENQVTNLVELVEQFEV